jgi:hypothetical protein
MIQKLYASSKLVWHILECPFIVPSTRCTCVMIMLFNQFLDLPHLSSGWIILAKEKCSQTGMPTHLCTEIIFLSVWNISRINTSHVAFVFLLITGWNIKGWKEAIHNHILFWKVRMQTWILCLEMKEWANGLMKGIRWRLMPNRDDCPTKQCAGFCAYATRPKIVHLTWVLIKRALMNAFRFHVFQCT